MVCSLDFTSLSGALAIGAGSAFAAWAVWVGRDQLAAARLLPAAAGLRLSGPAALAHSADAYVGLMQQARLRIEGGLDASELFETAIGLVRARRLFIIVVTVILWAAAMLGAQQFFGGNARCLRMMVETKPAMTDFAIRHPLPVEPAAARTRPAADEKTMPMIRARVYTISGMHSLSSDPVPLLPATRREAAHGPA